MNEPKYLKRPKDFDGPIPYESDSDENKYLAWREYRRIQEDKNKASELTKNEERKLLIAILVISLFYWRVTGRISGGIGCAFFAFVIYGGSLSEALPNIIRDDNLPSEKCKSAFFHGVFATCLFFLFVWMGPSCVK